MTSLALIPVAILVSFISSQLALREAALWGISLSKPISKPSAFLWGLLFWVGAAGLCISETWGAGISRSPRQFTVEGRGNIEGAELASSDFEADVKRGFSDRVHRFLTGGITPADVIAIVFVTLIVTAMRVDLATMTIPDLITLPGLIAGLVFSLLFPLHELVPVWGVSSLDSTSVSFDALASQRSFFAEQGRAVLRWFAGVVCGAGVIWLIRLGAGWSLRTEALGFGDVTLMAAVGGFLGWQATLLSLMLSPVIGIGHAGIARCFGKAVLIPFGPSLGIAAFVIAWNWSWVWSWASTYLNDPVMVLVLGGLSLGGFAAGMLLLRVEKTPLEQPEKSRDKSKKSKRRRK